MDNCTYNKIKILHEMSKLAGFIEMHGLRDAKSSRHQRCHKAIRHLHGVLQAHMAQLHKELGKVKV